MSSHVITAVKILVIRKKRGKLITNKKKWLLNLARFRCWDHSSGRRLGHKQGNPWRSSQWIVGSPMVSSRSCVPYPFDHRRATQWGIYRYRRRPNDQNTGRWTSMATIHEGTSQIQERGKVDRESAQQWHKCGEKNYVKNTVCYRLTWWVSSVVPPLTESGERLWFERERERERGKESHSYINKI